LRIVFIFCFFNAYSIQDNYYFVSGVDLKNCHAKYGAIDKVVDDLQSYANAHIAHSFDYLLMVCMYSVVYRN
jgi:predicted RNase H-like HicB family nuclease